MNATFGLCERLRVESIDEVASVLALGMEASKKMGPSKRVSGRTFDLKSAYKQFGVCGADVERLKIAVKNPDKGVSYFNVLALPFGATGSVVAFLRVSAAIAHVGVHGLYLPWTAFFDDYTIVCPEGSEDQTTFFVESLFKLVGISYAAEGHKAPPFTESFKALGLLVDAGNFTQGSIELGHTPERKTELIEAIGSIIHEGHTTPKALEKLHGRMVWYNSFIFGRKLNFSVRRISKFARLSFKSAGC